jgi:hypothetical protein
VSSGENVPVGKIHLQNPECTIHAQGFGAKPHIIDRITPYAFPTRLPQCQRPRRRPRLQGPSTSFSCSPTISAGAISAATVLPSPPPTSTASPAKACAFTHCLSANPVCSPSRAALLTGRYPTRVGVPTVLFPRDRTGLADGEQTIAQLLKAKGYNTACVGKWHLGHTPPNLPTFKGFDSYFGIPYSNDMSPRWLMDGEKVLEEETPLDTLTPRYTERAVQFIGQNKDSPFFLYFPHTYPHIPLGASKAFRGKSPHGIYGDVIAELDWSVGELVAALKKTRPRQEHPFPLLLR